MYHIEAIRTQYMLDEIEFPSPKPPVRDILGGAGSYSALGARIFSSPPTSKSVGWIVDCGSDFPLDLRETIASWNTGVVFRETPERLTTRGWNGYGDNEYRGESNRKHHMMKQPLRARCQHFGTQHQNCDLTPIP